MIVDQVVRIVRIVDGKEREVVVVNSAEEVVRLNW